MRFIQDNLIVLVTALVLVVAVACWYNIPVPAQPGTTQTVSEPWALPKPAEHDSAKSLDAINTRNLWGIVPPAPVDAVKLPQWRVLGIARRGDDRFVLLAYEGKPVEILRVGDALPDNLKIVKIEDDRFFVLNAKKKKIAFGIYKNDPEK